MTGLLKFSTRIIAFCLLVFSIPTFAIIEGRARGGLALISPSDIDRTASGYNVPQLFIYPTVGLDGLLNVPGSKLGLGVRYDYSGIKYGSGSGFNGEAELQVTRWAGLIRYGLIDGTGIVGLIGSFGFAHNTSYSIKSYANPKVDYSSKGGTSFTLGFDAGFALGPVRLGTEVGYQYFWVDALGAANGRSVKADFRGVYVYGFVGFAI